MRAYEAREADNRVCCIHAGGGGNALEHGRDNVVDERSEDSQVFPAVTAALSKASSVCCTSVKILSTSFRFSNPATGDDAGTGGKVARGGNAKSDWSTSSCNCGTGLPELLRGSSAIDTALEELLA